MNNSSNKEIKVPYHVTSNYIDIVNLDATINTKDREDVKMNE